MILNIFSCIYYGVNTYSCACFNNEARIGFTQRTVVAKDFKGVEVTSRQSGFES